MSSLSTVTPIVPGPMVVAGYGVVVVMVVVGPPPLVMVMVRPRVVMPAAVAGVGGGEDSQQCPGQKGVERKWLSLRHCCNNNNEKLIIVYDYDNIIK